LACAILQTVLHSKPCDLFIVERFEDKCDLVLKLTYINYPLTIGLGLGINNKCGMPFLRPDPETIFYQRARFEVVHALSNLTNWIDQFGL
jgi:hypothetical protein